MKTKLKRRAPKGRDLADLGTCNESFSGFQTVTSLQSRTKRLRSRVVPFREQFANYVRATLPRRAPIIANVTTPMASSLCGDFASNRSDTKSDSEEPAPGGAEKSPTACARRYWEHLHHRQAARVLVGPRTDAVKALRDERCSPARQKRRDGVQFAHALEQDAEPARGGHRPAGRRDRPFVHPCGRCRQHGHERADAGQPGDDGGHDAVRAYSSRKVSRGERAINQRTAGSW